MIEINSNFWKEKCIKNRDYNIIRCKFSEFDAIMDQFLEEAKLLDPRSLFSVKKKDPPLKERYNGPLEYLFTPFTNVMICHAYPKNMKPVNLDDAIDKVIWNHITNYN